MKASSLFKKKKTLISIPKDPYKKNKTKQRRRKEEKQGEREKENMHSPTILMRLDQLIRLLPREQVHHQLPQAAPLPDPFLAEDGPRVVGRGHAVGAVRHPGHHVDDAVLAALDLQLVRQQPQPDQPEVGRVVAVELLVVERAGVDPLHEVLEVARARGRQVHRGRVGLAEGVRRVEGRGEEGGRGAEALPVHEEGDRVRAGGDGDDRLEQGARGRLGRAREGARVGVLDGGRGGVAGGGGAGIRVPEGVVVAAAAVGDGRHLPGCHGEDMSGGFWSACR